MDVLDAIAMSDGERERFEVELEFVQSLANPYYLNCKFVCQWYCFILSNLYDFQFLHSTDTSRTNRL